MEIARLTAICRKTKCGPLENEIVRLRAQVAALEERKTGDSVSEAEEEMEFASQADADGELARANAELEKRRMRISTARTSDLQSKNNDLEIELLNTKSELAYRKCEMCVGHEEYCLQIVVRPIRPGADRELAAAQAGNRTRGGKRKTKGSDGYDGDGGPRGGIRG
jgi:hypothetical protein